MRLPCLLVCLVATASLADVILPSLPTDTCTGKRAGDTCSATGTCVAQQVRRPDFSTSPPTYKTVEVLVCVERAASRVPARPVMGTALGMLLVAALLILRHHLQTRPGVRTPA